MSDESKVLAESQNAEAVNAVAVATEAAQKAQASQMEAAFEAGMNRFFSRGVQEKKFIDVGRIPFICDDLHGVHETQNTILKNQEIQGTILEKIKNDMWWYRVIGGGFLMAAGLLALKALGIG